MCDAMFAFTMAESTSSEATVQTPSNYDDCRDLDEEAQCDTVDGNDLNDVFARQAA